MLDGGRLKYLDLLPLFLIFFVANIFILEFLAQLYAMPISPIPYFGYTNIILYAAWFILLDALRNSSYFY